jgi:pimeloyl-ACP methyl ester carboxylesterase
MKFKGTTRKLAGVVCATALVAGLAGAVSPAAPAAAAFEPKLSYFKCPPKSLPVGVKCATLTVPLDWQTPNDGRTTTIDVRVVRSKEGKGGLTFNPGGPGGSGIDALPGVYSMLPDEVVGQFDFVAWDPRGVGGSGPKITGPAQAFIGIALTSGDPGGAEVVGTKPGSPAAVAELVKGDFVTKVGDRVIDNSAEFAAAIRESAPGETLVVEYLRGGTLRQTTIILGSVEAGCQYPTLYPASTGPVDWREFWQKYADENAAANAACLAANPDSVPYVGTWQVVRDLDALRAALGYSQWNYWGMSYGTRIGYAYASTFPNNLRAVIMDGSLPAYETTYGLGTSFPANYWMSVQIFPALTAPAAARKITAIEEYLNGTVLALPDGTEFTRWDWLEQFRTLLSSQSQYPTARALINNLYGGITATTQAERAKRLAVVAAISDQVSAVNDGDLNTLPIFVLVQCSDLHDRPTVEELANASEQTELNYGTGFPLLIESSAKCFGLAPDDLSPAVPNVKTPPMFVLSSGDAATPWVWGRSLANMFVGSRTITYDSTQHVAYLFTPSNCVNAPVTQYLLTLTLPARNRLCAFSPSDPVNQR